MERSRLCEDEFSMKCDAGKFVNSSNLEAKRRLSAALIRTVRQFLEKKAREFSISRPQAIDPFARSSTSAKPVRVDQQPALAARLQQHLAKLIPPEIRVEAIATAFYEQGG